MSGMDGQAVDVVLVDGGGREVTESVSAAVKVRLTPPADLDFYFEDELRLTSTDGLIPPGSRVRIAADEWAVEIPIEWNMAPGSGPVTIT